MICESEGAGNTIAARALGTGKPPASARFAPAYGRAASLGRESRVRAIRSALRGRRLRRYPSRLATDLPRRSRIRASPATHSGTNAAPKNPQNVRGAVPSAASASSCVAPA